MLPEAFLNRMRSQLGDSYVAYLDSLERPRSVGLRFNPLKGPDVLDLPFGLEPIPWAEHGYYYDGTTRPGLHPFHEAGVYYLQEASAMAPVTLLDPQPGECILDLCAAPGGKTTQIAGAMQGKGFLVCNEVNGKRAKILSRNVERMGVANALVLNEFPGNLAKHFQEAFDRVLVDAPCSGEGMFRKEAAAVEDWSPETVTMCANRQLEILDSAAVMLRPGGRLVYSTCTFAPEEDEGVVVAFLKKHPEFSMEEVPAPWFEPGVDLPGSYRLWPHKLRGEGHFAAVLRKQGDQPRQGTGCLGMKADPAWAAFAKEMELSVPEGKYLTFGQSLYLVPEQLPELKGLRVLRPGLELGQAKPGRFEPAHALALWLKDCKRACSFPAAGPEIQAYLHGDTIPAPVTGWCLVQADGYSLGWGKGDGRVLKNHYPKGLRRL